MEISFTISSTIFKYNQKYFINSQYQPICNNISLTWLVHALINNSYWFSNFKVFKVWQRMKANRTNLKLLFNKSNSGFPMKMLMGLSRKWTKGSSLPKIPRLRVGGGGMVRLTQKRTLSWKCSYPSSPNPEASHPNKNKGKTSNEPNKHFRSPLTTGRKLAELT